MSSTRMAPGGAAVERRLLPRRAGAITAAKHSVFRALDCLMAAPGGCSAAKLDAVAEVFARIRALSDRMPRVPCGREGV